MTPSSAGICTVWHEAFPCKGLPLPSKEAIAKLQSTEAQATASSSASTGAANGTAEKRKQIVTPWEVDADGGVDYDKLVRDYGSSALTAELVQRMEKLTGREAHPWLRRGIFFSHRDLNHILDLYEKGEKFYIYTGRGPSSDSLHGAPRLSFHKGYGSLRCPS